MWEMAVILVSFMVAVATLLKEEGKGSLTRGLQGLSQSGRVLVALAVMGLIAGLGNHW